jgi:oligosaccharide repeat unit polymerase
LAGSLFAVIVIIYSIENRKRGLDLFSPYSVFLVMFFFYFPFKAFDIIFFGKYDEATLTMALIYIIIGLFSFFTGYYLKIGTMLGKMIKPMPDDLSRSKTLVISVIMAAFGVSLYFLILKMADFGGIIGAYTNMWRFRRIAFSQGMAYFTILMQLFLNIPLTVWFIYLIKQEKPRKAVWLLFCIYLIGILLIQFSFGTRGMVVGIFLSLIICYQYLKRSISFKYLAVIALFLILLIGFATAFRGVAMGGISIGEVVTASAGLPAQEYLNILISRLDVLSFFMTILQDFPTQGMDFQYGRTLLNIFVQPIPRSLFQEKPYLIGDIFTQQFYPESVGWVSLDPSIFGEMYMNLHVAGIVIGLYLLGIICRVCQVYLEKNLNNKGVILFYTQIFGFPASFLGPGFNSATTINFLFCLVVVLACLNLIKSREVKQA